MFCPECGKTVEEGTVFCSECGARVSEAFGKKEVVAGEGGAVKGFFLLLASFFMMPLKTLRLTVYQLRELGRKGSLEVEATGIPHLTWLGIAGYLFVSIAVILIFVIGVIMGLSAFFARIKYSPAEALGMLLLGPIGGVFLAVIADWLIMISLEILGLWTGIANNIRAIEQKIKERPL